MTARDLPELPEPVSSIALAAWGPKPDYYTADQMHQYARDHAAALAGVGAVAWRRDAEDLLQRLRTMQPPNVVLQQITMLGEARDILTAALEAKPHA
jgi:hypothetical protein